MKKFLVLLLAAVMIFTMTLVPASAEPSKDDSQEGIAEKVAEVPRDEDSYKEGELLVVMKDSVSDRKAEKVAATQGDQLKEAVDVGTGGDEQTVAVVDTDSSTANQLEDSMEEYAKRDDVEFVQPNFIYKASDEETTGAAETAGDESAALEPKNNQPNLEESQWALKKDAIDAREGWDILEANKKRTVKVAVLDTGLDVNHPDFTYTDAQGKKQCVIDKDHSVETYSSKTSKITKDQVGHGTHVAGIIAAANNGYGVTGVGAGKTNSAIKVMGIRVFNASGKYGTTISVARGIDYAVKNGAKIINMSLGSIKGDEDKAMRKSVSSAYGKGVTLICAAGNDQTDGVAEIPACYGKTISVANSGKHHLLHETSTYGTAIDIAAPGVAMFSTWSRQSSYGRNEYMELSGTSMATPVVSGIAAMMYAVDTGAYPKKVRDILCKTTTDMYSPGKDRYSGYGMVNSRRALTAVTGGGYAKASRTIKPVKIHSVTHQAATISWNCFPTAGDYMIEIRPKGSRYYSPVKLQKNTTYRKYKMTTGKTYNIRVLVRDRVGPGRNEYYVLGQGQVTPKPPRVKVYGKAINKRKIRISWTKSLGATGYAVYRSTGKNGKYKRIATTRSNHRYYVDKYRIRGRAYYYKVRGFRKMKKKNIYGKASDVRRVRAK